MKRVLAGCLVLLLTIAGCKAIISIGVHKDWVVDNPLPNPDLRTKAEIRFEKDFGNKSRHK